MMDSLTEMPVCTPEPEREIRSPDRPSVAAQGSPAPTIGEDPSIAAIRLGDSRAFETLYRTHAPGLLAFAVRWLRASDDAEGVVQDVFMRLWEQRASLAVRVSLRALLYRATRNRLLDVAKRGRVELAWDEQASREAPAAGPDAHARLEASELRRALAGALLALPPRARQVIELRLHHGLGNREIAEVMGISLKAVEANRARALRHLRMALAPWATGERSQP